jgi:hypothetical protein
VQKKTWVLQLVAGTRATKNSLKNFGSNRFLFKKKYSLQYTPLTAWKRVGGGGWGWRIGKEGRAFLHITI